MTQRVIVSGAGIAGLATALRLHRAGWDVLVVERAPARRSSGYMVNLIGPGYEAAERLGLLPGLTERDLGVFTSILTKADGREKFKVPAAVVQAAVGKRAMTVFRGDLESVLYEQVRDIVTIRFGTTVQAVGQNGDEVQVDLSDGSSERADLLVGADGLHSGVRELMFSPGTDFKVDLRHLVGAFPLSRVPRDIPDGASTTFIGPGRTAAVINLGPGRSSAFFTYRSDDPAAELAKGSAKALNAAFGDLGGAVPDALRQVTADAYFDSVSQVVMDTWRNGRVVLLGDAAWCVTLFAGYGAALALNGADELGAVLEEHGSNVSAALTDWETRLRPEVLKRQALARKGTAQFAPPSQAHVWARDLVMRAIQLPGIRTLIQRSIQRANQ
ncbi:2-polyprenyl-6-methoxyphenol hydroxylase-like FAD-dependent oxidoreductase [Kibdelosporangium banguiense]|uniref:2-polyprenyl-6-methoxyphenol hydroxylase-like FAD-dependent oxidoreductase n=1 Tax=Kibdelosporangium banguiense TaxID=1365924 RepID=A0ABS4T7G8_9PSEU|nr:FAD-dependent oxidoreductase [Kibdelosporangium banguiense]MBP2320365.1 2-polyprenyl-6-methoxyphenol hydroxylase-like FAD-dependent oxidoreductase [Kibdelosporangium banguiense]